MDFIVKISRVYCRFAITESPCILYTVHMNDVFFFFLAIYFFGQQRKNLSRPTSYCTPNNEYTRQRLPIGGTFDIYLFFYYRNTTIALSTAWHGIGAHYPGRAPVHVAGKESSPVMPRYALLCPV